MKPNKQVIINEITPHIAAGNGRGNVMAIIAPKWQISDRTFSRYWKIAITQHQQLQGLASMAADAIYIAAKEGAAKELVMSKAERLHILSKIARGEDHPVTVLIIERIKAISELNKMEGDYAPAKVAQTDKDGNNISPVIRIIQVGGNEYPILENE